MAIRSAKLLDDTRRMKSVFCGRDSSPFTARMPPPQSLQLRHAQATVGIRQRVGRIRQENHRRRIRVPVQQSRNVLASVPKNVWGASQPSKKEQKLAPVKVASYTRIHRAHKQRRLSETRLDFGQIFYGNQKPVF